MFCRLFPRRHPYKEVALNWMRRYDDVVQVIFDAKLGMPSIKTQTI